MPTVGLGTFQGTHDWSVSMAVVYLGYQSTRHTVNSSHSQLVTRATIMQLVRRRAP